MKRSCPASVLCILCAIGYMPRVLFAEVLFSSELMRGGMDVLPIAADVTGLESITLVATIGPDDFRFEADVGVEADLAQGTVVFKVVRGVGDALRREDNAKVEPFVQVERLILARQRREPRQRKMLSDAITRLESLNAALDYEGLALLRREILLETNPAVDFDEILAIRRKSWDRALPQNWQSNSSLPRGGYDDEIIAISVRDPDATPRVVFRPPNGAFVGDLVLHWDASRFLFSMSDPRGRWHVYEMGVDGTGLRQVTPDMGGNVDNYDGCYLPNGSYLFTSTAGMVAVPCVAGGSHVATLFRYDPGEERIRQLCFDQEHNWTPRVMNNGQILYQRWEYTDTPHSNTRLLMTMNPDGTNQRSLYGSNSYWPTSFFYANPVPGHHSRVFGIAGGHHGVRRVGELILLDPELGHREPRGVVQQLPGWGKPFPYRLSDPYANPVNPRFLHPNPLSEEFLLVARQERHGQTWGQWGIYLADVYDNFVLLAAESGFALHEPVALRTRPVPPVIPDRVNLSSEQATIMIADIYAGPGLKGIPRGTVKSLRVSSYTYGHHGAGGLYGVIGMDGPWDVRRMMGTVPVEPDGSAFFRVPANVPITIQPLDADGKALALMRSWMTAMPGETLSCVGCHEPPNEPPRNLGLSRAMRRAPSEIKPWHGPPRGFRFAREVQPVLDAACISCHNGQLEGVMDLRGTERLQGYRTSVSGHGGSLAGNFSLAYANLFPFVRGPGIESDYHLLTPMEFHADSTELIQMLKKGHHGVRIEGEALDRLVAWIDLNTPYHGDWSSIIGADRAQRLEAARAEMRLRYGGVDENHEVVSDLLPVVLDTPPRFAEKEPVNEPPVVVPGWPFDAATAKAMQTQPPRKVALDDDYKIGFVYIPAGTFVMGSSDGHPDERPRAVRIEKPFWMGRFEITNEAFRQFDPEHDSKVAIRSNYQFGVRDLSMSEPRQPAVRISRLQAEAFCAWMSERTGLDISLPTEAEWEWACRAGSDQAFSFGPVDADFSTFANLADRQIAGFAANTSARGYTAVERIRNPSRFDNYIPHCERFDDGAMITTDVGRYQPNAWGLHDMHGNVAEWTSGQYGETGEAVVRGGSYLSRPARATASYRVPYQPYHPVHDVGFRVVIRER
jgi:formylglycine-generating enzyme required for sulfatase activity